MVFAGLDPGYEPARLRVALAALVPGSEHSLDADQMSSSTTKHAWMTRPQPDLAVELLI